MHNSPPGEIDETPHPLINSCPASHPSHAASAPTVAEAEKFMAQAEDRLRDLSIKAARAGWVQENFITDDTEAIATEANDQLSAATTELIEQAKRFDGLKLPPELARQFLLLKLQNIAPTPKDPKLRHEMSETASWLDGEYGKAKYCKKAEDKDSCLDITAIEKNPLRKPAIPKNSKTSGWLAQHWSPNAPALRALCRTLQPGRPRNGIQSTGALWRAGYDMKPEEFSDTSERLCSSAPLYLSCTRMCVPSS